MDRLPPNVGPNSEESGFGTLFNYGNPKIPNIPNFKNEGENGENLQRPRLGNKVENLPANTVYSGVKDDNKLDINKWRLETKQTFKIFAPDWGKVNPPAVPTMQDLYQYNGFVKMLYESLGGTQLKCAILGATPPLRALATSGYFGLIDTIDFCKEMIDDCEPLVQTLRASGRDKETVFLAEWHDFFDAKDKEVFQLKYCGKWYNRKPKVNTVYDVVLADVSFNCLCGEEDLASLLELVRGQLHDNSQIITRTVVLPTRNIYPPIGQDDLIEVSKSFPERTGALAHQYCLTNPHIRNPQPNQKYHRDDVPVGTVDYGKYNNEVKSWVEEGRIDAGFAERLRVGPLNFGNFKLYVPNESTFRSVVSKAGFKIKPYFINDGLCGPSFPMYVLTLTQ